MGKLNRILSSLLGASIEIRGSSNAAKKYQPGNSTGANVISSRRVSNRRRHQVRRLNENKVINAGGVKKERNRFVAA